MEVKAKLKNLRISPRKVRLVINTIRGLKVEEALTSLDFINKNASSPVKKLLLSAVANAENNHQLEKSNLYIKKIVCDEGFTLKRWLPRAHGRATTLRKRASQIELILDELVPSKKPAKKKQEKPEVTPVSKVVKEQGSTKIADKDKISDKPKEDASIKETAEQEKVNEAFDVRMKGKHRHAQHQDKVQQKDKKGGIKQFFRRKAS